MSFVFVCVCFAVLSKCRLLIFFLSEASVRQFLFLFSLSESKLSIFL